MRQPQQVVAGAAARVQRGRVEQRADLAQRVAQSPVGRPPTQRAAGVGASSPRITRIVVDLPAPFGPTNPVTCPGWTVNDSPSTATVCAVPLAQLAHLDGCFHGRRRYERGAGARRPAAGASSPRARSPRSGDDRHVGGREGRRRARRRPDMAVCGRLADCAPARVLAAAAVVEAMVCAAGSLRGAVALAASACSPPRRSCSRRTPADRGRAVVAAATLIIARSCHRVAGRGRRACIALYASPSASRRWRRARRSRSPFAVYADGRRHRRCLAAVLLAPALAARRRRANATPARGRARRRRCWSTPPAASGPASPASCTTWWPTTSR